MTSVNVLMIDYATKIKFKETKVITMYMNISPYEFF